MNYSTQPYQQPQYNPYMQPQSWQQQRIAELEQRLPQQYPQYQQPQQMAQPYPCMPVTSVDEVKAMQVDFTGKPSFFWNASSNEVYIKQLNMDTGASQVKTYTLTQPEGAQSVPVVAQDNQPAQPNYATQGDLEALRNELTSMIGGNGNELNATSNATEDGADSKQSDVPAGTTNVQRKKS